MTLDIQRFVSPRTVAALREQGLHKVAGAMVGAAEMTLKEAAFLVGAKARLRRHETQKIAAGLQALAEVSGEKVAASALGALLQHSLPAAALGAGIATVPKVLSGEPITMDNLLMPAVMGGGLGLVGGAGQALHRYGIEHPGEAQLMTQRLHEQSGRAQ